MIRVLIICIVIMVNTYGQNSEYIYLPCENYNKDYIRKWKLKGADHRGKMVTIVDSIEGDMITVKEVNIKTMNESKQILKKEHKMRYIRNSEGLIILMNQKNYTSYLFSKPIQICGKMKKYSRTKSTQKTLTGNFDLHEILRIKKRQNATVNVPAGTFETQVFEITTETDYGEKYSYANSRSVNIRYMAKDIGLVKSIIKITLGEYVGPVDNAKIITSELVSYSNK